MTYREKVSMDLMTGLVKTRNNKKLEIQDELNKKSQMIADLYKKCENLVYSKDFQVKLFDTLTKYIADYKDADTIDKVVITVQAYFLDEDRLSITFRIRGQKDIDTCGIYPDYIKFTKEDYVELTEKGAEYLQGALKEYGFRDVHSSEGQDAGEWDDEYHFYEVEVYATIPRE